MMKLMNAQRWLVLSLFFCFFVAMQAQIPFMEHIRKDTGKGKLIVVQSAAIDCVINRNVKTAVPVIEADTIHKGQPERINGYRVQVYAGPKATGKQEALKYEKEIKKVFPGISTYVRFIQPRWTCRVGDFRTREDAQRFLEKVNEEKISTQTTIVRCQVFKVY